MRFSYVHCTDCVGWKFSRTSKNGELISFFFKSFSNDGHACDSLYGCRPSSIHFITDTLTFRLQWLLELFDLNLRPTRSKLLMLLCLLLAERNGNYFVSQLQINVYFSLCRWPKVLLLSELSNRIIYGDMQNVSMSILCDCLSGKWMGRRWVTISKLLLAYRHDVHLNFNKKKKNTK